MIRSYLPLAEPNARLYLLLCTLPSSQPRDSCRLFHLYLSSSSQVYRTASSPITPWMAVLSRHQPNQPQKQWNHSLLFSPCLLMLSFHGPPVSSPSSHLGSPSDMQPGQTTTTNHHHHHPNFQYFQSSASCHLHASIPPPPPPHASQKQQGHVGFLRSSRGLGPIVSLDTSRFPRGG
jgi:hypothetical protein